MCSMFGMRSLWGTGGGVTRSICDPNGWINIGGSATTADAKKSPRIEDFSIAAPALLFTVPARMWTNLFAGSKDSSPGTGGGRRSELIPIGFEYANGEVVHFRSV